MTHELQPKDSEIAASATFLGAGLFVGAMKDGQPFVYEGGMVRVRREDLSESAKNDNNRQVWEAGIRPVLAAVRSLSSLSDLTPAEGAQLELTGCCEAETGDWLILWRVACVKVVTH